MSEWLDRYVSVTFRHCTRAKHHDNLVARNPVSSLVTRKNSFRTHSLSWDFAFTI